MTSNLTTFAAPCAVPIVTVTAEHKFVLDESALNKVFNAPNLAHRKVVILSVVGAFRKGKSFLLNFFLRYLKARYVEKNQSDDWLGNEADILEGFSWSGGSKRNTTGILIWSEAFLVELENGDQLAVFLLDTQGTFDCESTVRDCATVFALSTMISSIQIYNLSQNIQEDDLQHLELFTEYGRLAFAESGSVPFQKLIFLVRDWSCPYEHEYGTNGGKVFLERRLRVSNTQNSEMQSLRTFIKSCFSSIECFLMPHPGLKVATNLDFQGQLSDIENEFKRYIRQLATDVLSPQRLICKEINGQKVKVSDLAFYFKSYIKAYSGNDLPEPKSMLVATAEANNLAAVSECRHHYTLKMEGLCAPEKPYLKTEQLIKQHENLRDQALGLFDERKKMGGDTFSGRYRQQLAADLDGLFAQFRVSNESKNAFKTWRTPAVLVTSLVLCYILWGLFSVLGLYRLADSFNTFVLIAVALLVMWSVSRYSGQYEEISSAVDFIAAFLWDNVLKPTYSKLKSSIAGEQVIGQMIEIGMKANRPSEDGKKAAQKMHQS